MAPAKVPPEAVTTVPAGPKGGVKVKLGGVGAVNDAVPKSPDVPVTVTVYAPLALGATLNDPDIIPLDIVQS